MRLALRVDGRTVDAVIGRDGAVEIDGHTWRVVPLGHGLHRVSGHLGSRIVAVAADAGRCWAFLDGHVGVIETARGGPAAAAHAEAPDLASPMPATVTRIIASRGSSVRRGDALVMLEAMKMELAIRAPRDGVVTAVHCRPGELVAAGVPLVELESR